MNSRSASLSLTASMLLATIPVIPSDRAVFSLSIGNEVPASAAAQGGQGRPFPAVKEPLPVALEHLHVRKEMMGEQDGLRALEVRVPRHYHVAEGFGLPDERTLHGAEQDGDAVDPAQEEEPRVERDLVVPAPRGMQFSPGIPCQRDETLLDGHVDVIRGETARRGVHVKPLCPAGSDLAPDALKGPGDLPGITGRDDVRGGEHADVREAPLDVLVRQPPVGLERRRKPERAGIERLPEPSFPLLHRTGTECMAGDSRRSSASAATAFWTWWYVRTGRPNILMNPSEAL